MIPDPLERAYELTHDHVNPGMAKLLRFAGFGVEDHAAGTRLFDHEGKEYLDFLGGYGVFSLGHSHPKVIAAVKAQMDRMSLSSKVFFSAQQGELAARLAALAPGNLQYSFFSNSGAEAVEAALKFARLTTGRERFLTTDNGYHGKTLGALSVTGRDKYRHGLGELIGPVDFLPFGDTDAMAKAFDTDVAGVLVEVVQGEGGVNVAPAGYLPALRELCDRHGAMLIVDEVQTGLGRTGAMFASQAEGVAPDIMTLAKALGGGIMPIGATMGTPAVWDRVFGENPLKHTSTFGGNPLACAAALATLDVIEDEGLCERAKARGDQLMKGLREIDSPLIAEVRGRGLLVGVEFALDEVGELMITQLVPRGVVAAYTLNNPRVVRMEPPLIVSEAEVDQAVEAFAGAVRDAESLLNELG